MPAVSETISAGRRKAAGLRANVQRPMAGHAFVENRETTNERASSRYGAARKISSASDAMSKDGRRQQQLVDRVLPEEALRDQRAPLGELPIEQPP